MKILLSMCFLSKNLMGERTIIIRSSYFKPLNTIRSSLKSVKDPIDPRDGKGVYIIPCSCGTPYIGETGRSINQRICEHVADIKHRRSHSSTLVEHA